MKAITTILIVSIVAALVSCSKGTTAQGTLYSASFGNLDTYIPRQLDVVHAAAVKSVESMGYSVKEQPLDVREGKVEGETALGRKVLVELRKTGTDVTNVHVYVGGDEAAGRELLDKIETGSGITAPQK